MRKNLQRRRRELVSVSYVPLSLKTPDVGESRYQFDTGGGTQHITQSIANIGKYAPDGQTAPDFQGAIGVTHDSVEGVDIEIPSYNFSETHYLSNSVVTAAYKQTLAALSKKVNNAPFKDFEAGEVFFHGASGSKTGDDKWEITFSFAASKNATNITIGDIVVPAKKGWQYLWVRYADSEDNSAKRVVKKPIAAYVEKVYEEADFSGLGILAATRSKK